MRQRINESVESYKARCRKQVNEWRANHRERHLESCRKLYLRNHDQIVARMRKWRDKNRERYNSECRKHNKTEKRRAYIREYRRLEYQNNPVKREKAKQRTKNYRKSHPNFSRFHKAKRKARLKNQMPSDADLKLIGIFYDIAKRVSECLGIEHHVDHIFPISKGGLHHQVNLQVLTAKLNQRKNNKIIPFRMVA